MTFKNLMPRGLIVLTDSVQRVIERLAQRDNTNFSYQLLESFQLAEVDYAENIANNLNIPIIASNVTDVANISYFIERLIKEF